MLHTETINLYDHYGLERGAENTGMLSCFYCEPDPEVSAKRVRPAVLILPGGAYYFVSNRESEPFAIRFASQGYAAFVLRYSVKPCVFPDPLRECALAMKYIRENCEKFAVDPHMIAAVGFSAGGHLCGMLGTMYDAPEVADIAPAEIIRPDALGLCYPVTISWGNTHADSFINLTCNDPALIERLSLDRLARKDMPPTFIWHTRADGLVPSRNAVVLAHALDDLDVDYCLHVFHCGQHGLATADELTFPAGDVPPLSRDIIGWEEKMCDFFRECGLTIRDL